MAGKTFIRYTHLETGKVEVLEEGPKVINRLYEYAVDVATDLVRIELVRNGKVVKSHEVKEPEEVATTKKPAAAGPAPDWILYVLVRTDMESMKYGKGSAQTGHACNCFTDDHIIQPLLDGRTPEQDAMQWRAQAGRFGTTLTLDVPSLNTMKAVVDAAKTLGIKADPCVDPTYPYLVPNEIVSRLDPLQHTMAPRPAGRTHTVCFTEETTTAYVFGTKAAVDVILGRFNLLSND